MTFWYPGSQRYLESYTNDFTHDLLLIFNLLRTGFFSGLLRFPGSLCIPIHEPSFFCHRSLLLISPWFFLLYDAPLLLCFIVFIAPLSYLRCFSHPRNTLTHSLGYSRPRRFNHHAALDTMIFLFSFSSLFTITQRILCQPFPPLLFFSSKM
jgi:hypothetical protein